MWIDTLGCCWNGQLAAKLKKACEGKGVLKFFACRNKQEAL
jgi:hypothetical protein